MKYGDRCQVGDKLLPAEYRPPLDELPCAGSRMAKNEIMNKNRKWKGGDKKEDEVHKGRCKGMMRKNRCVTKSQKRSWTSTNSKDIMNVRIDF